MAQSQQPSLGGMSNVEQLIECLLPLSTLGIRKWRERSTSRVKDVYSRSLALARIDTCKRRAFLRSHLGADKGWRWWKCRDCEKVTRSAALRITKNDQLGRGCESGPAIAAQRGRLPLAVCVCGQRGDAHHAHTTVVVAAPVLLARTIICLCAWAFRTRLPANAFPMHF